ncbi:hypothetical protein ABH935_005412 [Catenulispora sp. GAS73]|uniref:hypothetical protein n=1 Tax=Catenulispora sp. GAS73 TaxID=3156269 RepID=UPI0035119047
MTKNCTTAAGPIASAAGRNAPAPAATDLAHDMLNSGWTFASATVRVIHTARLTDGSGLTVAVSSEAGKVRLDFNSEYRRLDGYLSRPAWHAEATRELPVEALAAVASANAVANDEDPTDLGEVLTAAGWSQPHPSERKWISPDQDREVMLFDDQLEDNALPWRIRRTAGRPVTVHASDDTPTAVILALALTDTGQR